MLSPLKGYGGWDALARLSAHKRWVVTGTPISKGLRDLLPMLAFTKTVLGEKSWFVACVEEPVENGGKGGLLLARDKLLRVLCRHTSSQTESDGAPLLVLPDKFEHTQLVSANAAEGHVASLAEESLRVLVNRFSSMIETGNGGGAKGLRSRKLFGATRAALQRLRRILAGEPADKVRSQFLKCK